MAFMSPLLPIPPINPQTLAGVGSFIQHMLRGALGVEDYRVAVDTITIRLEANPDIVRELRPEIHEYLRIEGVKATAELLVAWATFQESMSHIEREKTRARVADAAMVELRARRVLKEMLAENRRLRGQLFAAVQEDARLREHLQALLTHGEERPQDAMRPPGPPEQPGPLSATGETEELRVKLALHDMLPLPERRAPTDE